MSADNNFRREILIPEDQIGFEIPNKWVENFGLDTDGLHRNGPNITYRNFSV